jgi:hypothetical protein
MADRSGVALTRPKFYPSVAELMAESDRLIRGHSSVVSFTSFKSGYSILSLEASTNGNRSRYSSPAAVVATLEESIMDHILAAREIPFKADAEPYTKRKLLSELLCSDLGKDAHRMRPEPIYIDWAQDCTFSTQGIPRPRLNKFAQVPQQVPGKESASLGSHESINMASISESTFGVVINAAIVAPLSIVSQ